MSGVRPSENSFGDKAMKHWTLIDYLYMTKPIYMGLLFAAILFACGEKGNMARGVSKNDTTHAAMTYGTVGPTADSTREMISGDLKPGASFTHVFTKAGDYLYFCRYHGGPKGTGMADSLHVRPATGKPTLHHVTITTYKYPSLNINAGDTVTWTNSTDETHTVETTR